MLDLESVRQFLLAVEYANLTRAAEAAGTVQPVISQRIKALEGTLGYRLLDRSPRFVRLTEAGAAFADKARVLLAAHDAALAPMAAETLPLKLGISDHTLGTKLDDVLRQVRAALPARAAIAVTLAQSTDVRRQFEAAETDLAIVRREAADGDGEVLGQDPLEWYASEGGPCCGGETPLVLLPAPCGVRAIALATLERQRIAWREAFVGGSCLALVAAVRAGLGVAPLGRIVGRDLRVAEGLPPLPPSNIVLLSRTPNQTTARAASALAASVRDLLR